MEIEGYKNYLIYDDGRCLSNGKFLKPRTAKGGYKRYMLYDNGKPKAFSIHRLVANAYIPNPNNYKIVNHKNGNVEDNTVNNLEWCSSMYNGQSFNKPNTNKGTIRIYHGVRGDTFMGQVRIYGKIYQTKSYKTREEAIVALECLIEDKKNILIK